MNRWSHRLRLVFFDDGAVRQVDHTLKSGRFIGEDQRVAGPGDASASELANQVRSFHYKLTRSAKPKISNGRTRRGPKDPTVTS